MGKRLDPMVDWIGDWPIMHGERGDDLDPEHPLACFCGEPHYMECPEATTGGVASLTLHPRAD